jgi:TRAP-type C4-dicarboxylate transport system substrate-binding protein
MKKCKVALIMSSIFFFMTILSSSVMAKQLNFSSWLPPSHPIVADMMLPWMANVKKATDGRVDFKLLAKGIGHPKSYYDGVKNGIANAGYTCNNYTPGRFVASEGVEIPFLGDTSEAMSVAYWKTYQKYFIKANEYRGVKLLGVMVHGPGQIHNSKKAIKSVADLKGMKFRISGGIAGAVAKSLGMVGLQASATKNYEFLSRGVADGTLLPLESIKSFNLMKLVPYTTIVPGGLYNVSFYLVMNNDTFKSFSPADQKAVMAVSGQAWAKLAGRAWDAADRVGLADMKANGNSVETATPAFISEIKGATQHLEADWIKKANAKGVDGAAALKFFRGQVANYDVIN